MASEKRLIDGNKAQAVLMNLAEHLMETGKTKMAGVVGYAAEIIGKQRPIDAVEVEHGQWEEIGAADYQCSRCGFRFSSADPIAMFQYCRCGAKMDGGKDDGK